MEMYHTRLWTVERYLKLLRDKKQVPELWKSFLSGGFKELFKASNLYAELIAQIKELEFDHNQCCELNNLEAYRLTKFDSLKLEQVINQIRNG